MKRLFPIIMMTILMYTFSLAFGQQSDSTGIEPVDVRKLSEHDHDAFVQYLEKDGKSPVDYLVEKFNSCDIIILGETHQVRENCELIASMLLPLYERAGLRILGSEFIKSKYNNEVDEIVCSGNYNEHKVIQIFRGNAWPTWGFQEYMDIVRAVWRVNSSLQDGAEKLRLVGLDDDWSQYDTWFGPKRDRMYYFNQRLKREENLVETFVGAVEKYSGKSLVHIGFDHTFRQVPPKFGAVLHEKFGDKVFQVGLHKKYPTKENNGELIPFIEKIIAKNGMSPIGFDIENSPFAPLQDEHVFYFQHPLFNTFSDLARGYIFIKPLEDLRRVTWVPNFIDEENFEQAKAVALKAKWVKEDECNSPEELDRNLAGYFNGKRK